MDERHAEVENKNLGVFADVSPSSCKELWLNLHQAQSLRKLVSLYELQAENGNGYRGADLIWSTEGSTTDGAEEVVLYVLGYVCAKDLPPIVNNSQ